MFDFLKKVQRSPTELFTQFQKPAQEEKPKKSIIGSFIADTQNKLIGKVKKMVNNRLNEPLQAANLQDQEVVDQLVNIRERFRNKNTKPEITVNDFKNQLNIYMNNMLPPQEVQEAGFSTKPKQTAAGLLYPSIDGTAGFLKTDTAVLLVTNLNINQKNELIKQKKEPTIQSSGDEKKGILKSLIEKGKKLIGMQPQLITNSEQDEEDSEQVFANQRNTLQLDQYEGPSVSDIIEGFNMYPGSLEEYKKELENVQHPKILEQQCNCIKIKQKAQNNENPMSCGAKEVKIPEIDKCVVNAPWHKILFWKLMYNTSPNTVDVARYVIRPLVKPIEDFVNRYVIPALRCTGCYHGPSEVTWYEDIIYFFIYHEYEISCTYMYFREGFRASGWRRFLWKRLSGDLPKDTKLSPVQLIMLQFLTVGIGVPKPPENIDEQVVDYFKGGQFTDDDIRKQLGNVK